MEILLNNEQKRIINYSYHSVGKIIPNSRVSNEYIEGYKDGILDFLMTINQSIPDILGIVDPRD